MSMSRIVPYFVAVINQHLKATVSQCRVKKTKCMLSFSFPFLRWPGSNCFTRSSTSSMLHEYQNRRRDDIYSRSMNTCLLSSEDYEKDQPHDDHKSLEKDAALHLALSRLVGEFGKDSMLSLQRFYINRHAPVISTGSIKLDLALGIGGLPKGRMVEIFGQEASGKTTLALHIIKEAQKLGGYCAFLDVENAFEPSLLEAVGIERDNLLIASPNSAENSLCIVDTLLKSGSIDVIVVDSVAALVPQCELDGDIKNDSSTVLSQLMTKALRKIHMSLCQSQTLIVFINQVRNSGKISSGMVHEVTCGGNALKFYAAVRLQILRKGLLKSKNEIIGTSVSVQIVKNKLAQSMKKAEINIKFGKGICRESEILEMASKHGIIPQTENGYCISGRFFKDNIHAERFLAENEEVSDEIVASLRGQLFEHES